jgi:hypothetical protein
VILRWGISFLFAVYCTGLHGQGAYRAEPIIWGNGVVFRDLSEGGRNIGGIKIESLNGKVERTLQVPKHTFCRDITQGKAFILIHELIGQDSDSAQANDRRRFRNRILERPLSGGEWKEVGRAETPNKAWGSFARLDNGNFLAVAFRPSFTTEGGYTPWAILETTPKGELRQKEALGGGLTRSVWADPIDKQGWGRSNYPRWWAPLPTILRTPEHVVVGYEDIGWFFVFRTRDGAFERRVAMFDFIDEEVMQKTGPSPYPYVGLGCQPQPDGRILVASRSREAIEQAGRAFVAHIPLEIVENHKKVLDWEKKTQWIRDENLRQFPHVAWWSLDPATGKVSPEEPPHRFPDRIQSETELQNWFWRFKADGNLVHYQRAGANEGDKKTLTQKVLAVVGIN